MEPISVEERIKQIKIEDAAQRLRSLQQCVKSCRYVDDIDMTCLESIGEELGWSAHELMLECNNLLELAEMASYE